MRTFVIPVTEIFVALDLASPVTLTLAAFALGGALVTAFTVARSAQRRRRRLIAALSRRSRPVDARDVRSLVEHRLRDAGEMLGAAVLLLWEGGDDPWLEVAHWTGTECVLTHEPPDTFHPFVAADLTSEPFATEDAARAGASALRMERDGERRPHETAINRAIVERFALRRVVTCPLRVGEISGRLFAVLDRSPTEDDLAIAIAATRELGEAMSRVAETRRMLDLAALEERARLSRELHDGVLQSLAGAALHLKRAERLVDSAPAEISGVLATVQQLLADEQRDLRFYVQDLRPFMSQTGDPRAELEARLRLLCTRVAEVWGLRATLDAQAMPITPSVRATHDLYRIAQEALVNVARHGQSTHATLSISVEGNRARMTVQDNGRGFPFQGRFDDAALTERRIGPVTLKARVHAMGGTVAIDSSSSGARLEIDVPLNPVGA